MFRVGELADCGVEVAEVLFRNGIDVVALGVGQVFVVFGCFWMVVLGVGGVAAREVMALRRLGRGEVGLADGTEVVIKGGYVGNLPSHCKYDV